MARLLCIPLLAGLLLSPAVGAQLKAVETKAQKADRLVVTHSAGTLNLQSAPLIDAIDFLRESSGANIHVNWKALQEAGILPNTPVTVRLSGITLRQALNYVLAEAGAGSLGATWYVDAGVIEITTRTLADQVMITRVYMVGDLLADVPDFQGPAFDLQAVSQQAQQSTQGGTGSGGGGAGIFSSNSATNSQQNAQAKGDRAQELVKLITDTVSPQVWRANGGKASISYFNGMLVVTAPRSVQEAIGGR